MYSVIFAPPNGKHFRLYIRYPNMALIIKNPEMACIYVRYGGVIVAIVKLE